MLRTLLVLVSFVVAPSAVQARNCAEVNHVSDLGGGPPQIDQICGMPPSVNLAKTMAEKDHWGDSSVCGDDGLWAYFKEYVTNSEMDIRRELAQAAKDEKLASMPAQDAWEESSRKKNDDDVSFVRVSAWHNCLGHYSDDGRFLNQLIRRYHAAKTACQLYGPDLPASGEAFKKAKAFFMKWSESESAELSYRYLDAYYQGTVNTKALVGNMKGNLQAWENEIVSEGARVAKDAKQASGEIRDGIVRAHGVVNSALSEAGSPGESPSAPAVKDNQTLPPEALRGKEMLDNCLNGVTGSVQKAKAQRALSAIMANCAGTSVGICSQSLRGWLKTNNCE